MAAVINPCFQIGLDIRGRRCLVLGGGNEARIKSARLVEAGARVIVISPQVTPPLAAAAARGDLQWQRRQPDLRHDLDDVFLVMNTVRGDDRFLTGVFEACRQRHVLLNNYDAPEHSDFNMAALVSRGHLRVSISSSNASPALAGVIRRQLEAAFDDDFIDYLDGLGRIRALLKERIADFSERRERLRSLVAGFRLRAQVTLPEGWRQRLAEERRRAEEGAVPPPVPSGEG